MLTTTNVPNDWVPDIPDFSVISLPAYYFIFSQSKERFDDLCESSYAITKSSKNIFVFFITAISSFYAFILTKRTIYEWPILSIVVLLVVFILTVVVIYKLLILIKSRESVLKGSKPKEMLAKRVFDTVGKEDACIYYSEIVRLQTKIDFIVEVNKTRSKQYDFVLKLIATTLVGAPMALIF
jgi:hypothetical protein